MAIFNRRCSVSRSEANYRKYREFVREDFFECCAYCLLHEFVSSGKDNFELDHFRPKSNPLFSHIINCFHNIYYSCHVCNHHKRDSWPSDELENRGYRFVDPCKEIFEEHFTEDKDGRWVPITNAGRYTLMKLRLNRDHLVKIRGLWRRISETKGCDYINWNLPTKTQLSQLLEHDLEG